VPTLAEKIVLAVMGSIVFAFWGWMLWCAMVVHRVSEDAARLMPD
jgi:hypothetical protein